MSRRGTPQYRFHHSVRSILLPLSLFAPSFAPAHFLGHKLPRSLTLTPLYANRAIDGGPSLYESFNYFVKKNIRHAERLVSWTAIAEKEQVDRSCIFLGNDVRPRLLVKRDPWEPNGLEGIFLRFGSTKCLKGSQRRIFGGHMILRRMSMALQLCLIAFWSWIADALLRRPQSGRRGCLLQTVISTV